MGRARGIGWFGVPMLANVFRMRVLSVSCMTHPCTTHVRGLAMPLQMATKMGDWVVRTVDGALARNGMPKWQGVLNTEWGTTDNFDIGVDQKNPPKTPKKHIPRVSQPHATPASSA